MAAVGTVVYTEERQGSVRKVAMAWTCSAGGAVSGTPSTYQYSGEIVRLVTVPGAAAAAPTDNYDVTILDDDGTDVLMGAGVDRDTANTEQVLAASLGYIANDHLNLVVANAGAAKSGTVYLYIR